MVQHWKRTPSFHPFIQQGRFVRILVLLVIVLTFMPFDMINDYPYLSHCKAEGSSGSGIFEMAGENCCDSHQDCSCLLCHAITGSTYKFVISTERFAWCLDHMSLDFFASPHPIEVFRPPRA